MVSSSPGTGSGDFRVLLPYHPGFGESADAPAIGSLEDYVRHYVALFDALGLKSFHLVGASLGGRLAAEFALSHPDRVRRLVLVAPGGIAMPAFPQPDYSKIGYGDWPAYFTYDPNVVRPFWPEEPDEAFVAARAREAQTTGRIALSEGLDARRLAGLRAPTLAPLGKGRSHGARRQCAGVAGAHSGLDRQDHRSCRASVAG